MVEYFIFIFILLLMILLANVTGNKGFEKLKIKRTIDKKGVVEGEKFKLTLTVENKKWLPLSFLVIKEDFPKGLGSSPEASAFTEGNSVTHVSRLTVRWFERIKRTYSLYGNKRGTYLIREMNVALGDILGFISREEKLEDYLEVLVYPRLMEGKEFAFSGRSLQGDNIVKRWIFKDPIYIRGIREYSTQDRMKDIHWKTSLKMNKLMVKEYDFTSEREVIIILNVQCGNPYWENINEEEVDRGIRIAASLANEIVKQGTAVGMWTNAQTLNYSGNIKSEIRPSINGLRDIMEFCARIDYVAKLELNKYLLERSKDFSPNNIYILITPFLDDSSINTVVRLKNLGFATKLIDVSKNGELPFIDGIDKLVYKGEALYE